MPKQVLYATITPLGEARTDSISLQPYGCTKWHENDTVHRIEISVLEEVSQSEIGLNRFKEDEQ